MYVFFAIAVYHIADGLKGESNPTYPLKHAQQLREDLVNSKVMLSVIKGKLRISLWLPHKEKSCAGAAGFMSITSSCAPTLRRIYVDFLSSLEVPPSRSDRTDPECMMRALARLAELATDPSIASRTLKSPMSFSLVPSCASRQLTGLSVLMHNNGTTNTEFSAFPPDYRSERKCVYDLALL